MRENPVPDQDPVPPSLLQSHATFFKAIRDGDLAAFAPLIQALPTNVLSSMRDHEGHTPLHWAALNGDLPILTLLLETAPALLDIPSTAPVQLGQTPLHWAAVGGHVRAVMLLVDRYHANVSQTDSRGYGALAHAVHYGHIDIVHALLSRAPHLSDTVDTERHSALHWAAYFGHLHIVVYLTRVCRAPLNDPDSAGHTPLHRAAQKGHESVSQALLDAGADPAALDAAHRRPADLAPPHSTVLRVLQAGPYTDSAMLPCNPLRRRVAAWVLARARALRGYWFPAVFHALAVASHVAVVQVVEVRAPRSTVYVVVMYAALALALIASHVATFSDPGVTVRGGVDEFVRHIDAAIATGAVDRALSYATYCYQCLARRPARSRHSRQRGRCVMRFDHYCPLVNNDVGMGNHHALLLYAASIPVAQVMFIYACVVALWSTRDKDATVLAPLTKHPFVCLLVLVQAVLAAFAVVLTVTQVRQIVLGCTTFEFMTNRRLRQTHRPYDKGPVANIMSFLYMTGPGTQPLPPLYTDESQPQAIGKTSVLDV